MKKVLYSNNNRCPLTADYAKNTGSEYGSKWGVCINLEKRHAMTAYLLEANWTIDNKKIEETNDFIYFNGLA